MILVLKPTSAEMDVRLIASIPGWLLERELEAEPARPRQLRWVLPDEQTTVTYVDDHFLPGRYLVINGPAAEAAAQRVRNGLEVYELTDLRSLSRPDLELETGVALVNATALMLSERLDPEIFELYSQALQHLNVDLRRAAVFAVTYAPWRQFRDLLETLRDKDPEIGNDIQAAVQTLDQHGWK